MTYAVETTSLGLTTTLQVEGKSLSSTISGALEVLDSRGNAVAAFAHGAWTSAVPMLVNSSVTENIHPPVSA